MMPINIAPALKLIETKVGFAQTAWLLRYPILVGKQAKSQ
jgi:hypothetical protein